MKHFVKIVIAVAVLLQLTKTSQAQIDSLWVLNGIDIWTSEKVGIGTYPTSYELTINGKIHAEQVRVKLNVSAPDYVFKDDYNLMPLEELEMFVKTNRHLPEISPGGEMEENGIKLSDMCMLLLKKTEELTLYILEHENRLSVLEEKINNK